MTPWSLLSVTLGWAHPANTQDCQGMTQLRLPGFPWGSQPPQLCLQEAPSPWKAPNLHQDTSIMSKIQWGFNVVLWFMVIQTIMSQKGRGQEEGGGTSRPRSLWEQL